MTRNLITKSQLCSNCFTLGESAPTTRFEQVSGSSLDDKLFELLADKITIKKEFITGDKHV